MINLFFIFSSETCSVTERASIDNQRWWSVKLPGAVNVRDVAITINHGVAFLQQFTVFVIGWTFYQLFVYILLYICILEFLQTGGGLAK